MKRPSIIKEDLFEDYLNAVLAGDLSNCFRIVRSLIDADIEIVDLYENLFHRAQYAIGELWEKNRISVAKEHLATSITESLMTLAYPKLFSIERTGRKVVVSTSPNEFHQIGGKMVADVFETHGWDSYFLGANTSVEKLLEELRRRQPDLLVFSISLSTALPRLLDALNAARAEFPQLPVLVGGKAVKDGNLEGLRLDSGVTVMSHLEELDAFLTEASAV